VCGLGCLLSNRYVSNRLVEIVSSELELGSEGKRMYMDLELQRQPWLSRGLVEAMVL